MKTLHDYAMREEGAEEATCKVLKQIMPKIDELLSKKNKFYLKDVDTAYDVCRCVSPKQNGTSNV